PKPPTKRRNRGVPKSYGGAQPSTAPAAKPHDRQLGIDNPHPLIQGMWDAVRVLCEVKYFSEADWARLRWELFYANETMRKPTAASWEAVQHGLRDLLISPAEKRRCAIELKPPDPGEDEAVVSQLDAYRDSLKPV